jgi:hypothetical protein
VLRHLPAGLTSLLLLIASAGCGRPPEVAAVSADPSFLHLAYPRFLSVRLRWEPLTELAGLPPGRRPVAFVHLLDREGDVMRTFDHELVAAWRPGQPFDDEVKLFQSAIAPALAPGEYRLTVGLLLGEEERAALRVAGGEEVARGEYRIAIVDAPPADEGLPMFRFSSAFQDVETTGDVQFPTHRWFDGEAALEVSEVAGAGTLYLVLQIPGESDQFGLRLEQGAAQPALWITSPCSTAEARLAGAGRHEVLLPLAASAVPCAVRLAPNFRLEPMEPGGTPRSALLEAVSWSAGP